VEEETIIEITEIIEIIEIEILNALLQEKADVSIVEEMATGQEIVQMKMEEIDALIAVEMAI